MKGRARQEESAFYQICDVDNDYQSLEISEDLVNDFLSLRQSTAISELKRRRYESTAHMSSYDAELRAAELGYYSTDLAFITLKDAQSLLHRYIMATPMEPCARSSRASMEAYLPAYDENAGSLYLPLHLASIVDRKITFPVGAKEDKAYLESCCIQENVLPSKLWSSGHMVQSGQKISHRKNVLAMM